jgi:hypothetical protein
MNVLFHGNVQNIVMLNRKGKIKKKCLYKYCLFCFSSCPVCKVRSAFITPSKEWFDNKDDKHRLVKKHKNHLK